MSIATAGSAASAARRAEIRSLPQRIVDHRHDYFYVLPALLVMLVVIAFPIYYTIELSFFKTPPNLQMRDKVFVGLDNYKLVLSSSQFHRVTWQTFIWTFASTLFSFALGLAAALALHRDFAGRGLLRAIFLIPYVVSAVAASYVWKWLYHSDFGVIGALAVQLGLTDQPINFIDNTQTVLASLIVVNVWREFPFAMVMLMAGLQTVPEQLLRAAQVDGANAWQRFWHITMPHLKGVSMVTVLLLMVANFNSFIIPWIMTSGGPAGASEIWITDIYNIAFGRQRYGTASAYAVILFIVMMVLGYFYVKALTRGDEGGVMAEVRRGIDWWRWAGRAVIVALLAFTALPMFWMVLTSLKSQFAAMQYPPQWWPEEPTLRNYTRLVNPAGETGREFLRYFWNSFYVSALTTVIGVAIAVPAAYAFSRFRFPGRTFLFFTVLVRNMFPAVVFLMPLFLLMRWMGLVNTHASLILTYLTFGLPLSIWLLKGFFDNIPVQLEQAARIDGATRFQAFLLIVMPLSTPGIIATSIFAFIGAWNEYVYAYTFLSRQESMTLPVGIQRFFTEFATDWPGLMAATFLMSVPVVVLFLVLQKYFVQALTEGAVKH